MTTNLQAGPMVQMMLDILLLFGGESMSRLQSDSRRVKAIAAESCCSYLPSVLCPLRYDDAALVLARLDMMVEGDLRINLSLYKETR